jgi:hypothetical protein
MSAMSDEKLTNRANLFAQDELSRLRIHPDSVMLKLTADELIITVVAVKHALARAFVIGYAAAADECMRTFGELLTSPPPSLPRRKR